MTVIALPTTDRRIEPFTLGPPGRFTAPAPSASTGPAFNRVAFSAAHVVADPLAESDPWLDAPIDWDTTIGYRRHLRRLGLGVAEGIEHAHRGMGPDSP